MAEEEATLEAARMVAQEEDGLMAEAVMAEEEVTLEADMVDDQEGDQEGDNSRYSLRASSPPRFEPDDPRMLEYLEDHGYAVVKAVEPGQEEALDRIQSEFWDFHEALGTVRRDDTSTWGHDFLAHPATGIIAGMGFGHSRFCWSLRAFRPMPEWPTSGGWWHCDQNGMKPDRVGRVCVQGLVLLTPANEYTGGFCVIPGTHHMHAEYSARHPWAESQGDFLPVPEGDPIIAGGGVLLRAAPGDLILWDSRLIHCNSPAIAPLEEAPPGSVPPPTELKRLAGYVCFTPSAWCSPADRAKRARAALRMTTSTHWPHAFVPTGPAPSWMASRTPSDFSSAESR